MQTRVVKASFIFFSLSLLFLQPVFSQDISVTIRGDSGVHAEFVHDRLHVGILPEKMQAGKAKGETRFPIRSGGSLEATLSLGVTSMSLYLEKGDDLVVMQRGRETMLDGKGAANSTLLKLFYQQFADDYSDSLQFRMMQAKGIDAYEIDLFAQKKKQLGFLTERSSRGATPSFLEYMRKTVNYHYWSLLLAHPIVNANASTSILTVNALPAPMLEGFDQVNINDAQLLYSLPYRNFLKYYVIYFTSEANGFNKFRDYVTSSERKLAFASSHLKGEVYSWWMANHLVEECPRLSPALVKRFKGLIEENDTTHLYRPILASLCDPKQMQSNAAGDNTAGGEIKNKDQSAADQDISFTDLKGKKVKLDAFKGKVVYVDFWASWCGPCRRMMPFSKQLHEQLTEKQKKQIVFLYISIDAGEEAWKKAIEDLGIQGVNLISPGNWQSDACRYFQINSIPRYMILNKKGEVAEFNAKRPSDPTLQEDLIRLTEE